MGTYLIPLRYFLEIVQGVFLKVVGIAVLWPQIAALLACGLVPIALAILRSSKKLAEVLARRSLNRNYTVRL